MVQRKQVLRVTLWASFNHNVLARILFKVHVLNFCAFLQFNTYSRAYIVLLAPFLQAISEIPFFQVYLADIGEEIDKRCQLFFLLWFFLFLPKIGGGGGGPYPTCRSATEMINGHQINPDLDIFRQFHKHLQNMLTLCSRANIDERHPFRHALVVWCKFPRTQRND